MEKHSQYMVYTCILHSMFFADRVAMTESIGLKFFVTSLIINILSFNRLDANA